MTKGEMKVGELDIPDGLILIIPVILVHYDKEIWGEDPKEFKLERFSEGVSKATKEQFSYIPFGGGPRICIGQNIAMMEAEMATAMILQKFSFELSPSYAHAPFAIMTIHPQPKKLEKYLRENGLKGNSYKLLYGDLEELKKSVIEAKSKSINFSDNIAQKLIPFFLSAINKNGKSSFVWLGPYPVLLITNPEHVKEILTRNYVYLKQTHPNPLTKLLAQGTMAATNLDATFDRIADNIEDIK
ncbi:Cytochrome [Capsicum chinense]|nr:Cytochrome [Capsicum chinense]